jgi:hypothetical protein
VQVAVYKAMQSSQPLDDKSVADSENLGTLLIQSLAIPGTALVDVCRARPVLENLSSPLSVIACMAECRKEVS